MGKLGKLKLDDPVARDLVRDAVRAGVSLEEFLRARWTSLAPVSREMDLKRLHELWRREKPGNGNSVADLRAVRENH
jgi:hypothetical protein